jgi:hypothetical protein
MTPERNKDRPQQRRLQKSRHNVLGKSKLLLVLRYERIHSHTASFGAVSRPMLRLQASEAHVPETSVVPGNTQTKRKPIAFTEKEMIEVQDTEGVGSSHSMHKTICDQRSTIGLQRNARLFASLRCT